MYWAITYYNVPKFLYPPKKWIMFTFWLDCAQWPPGLCHRTNIKLLWIIPTTQVWLQRKLAFDANQNCRISRDIPLGEVWPQKCLKTHKEKSCLKTPLPFVTSYFFQGRTTTGHLQHGIPTAVKLVVTQRSFLLTLRSLSSLLLGSFQTGMMNAWMEVRNSCLPQVPTTGAFRGQKTSRDRIWAARILLLGRVSWWLFF